jgi:hypothetical protein
VEVDALGKPGVSVSAGVGVDEYGYEQATAVRFPVVFATISDIAITELQRSHFLFARKFPRGATVVPEINKQKGKQRGSGRSSVLLVKHLEKTLLVAEDQGPGGGGGEFE